MRMTIMLMIILIVILETLSTLVSKSLALALLPRSLKRRRIFPARIINSLLHDLESLEVVSVRGPCRLG